MTVLFEIYDRGRRLTDYVARAACVMGPESVPCEGRVWFEGGLLRVEGGEEDGAALGVALLWDAGATGRFLLETTRLPPRQAPYILNIELARHRLMKLVHKQEDWNLWEQSAVAEPVEKIRRAQQNFAEALGAMQDPARAATIADEALALAIQASEELAALHGEMLLSRRRSALPRVLLGVGIDPTVRNQRYRTTATKFFDYAILPMAWRNLQPEEDSFETDATDAAVEFLARQRLPAIAGPLVDLSEEGSPNWLFIYEHEFETLRDLAFRYVKTVATRYRRAVKHWNVVAGLNAASSFGLSFEQMIELTRLLVAQVKNVIPQARTLVTVRLPFGEYLAGPPTAPPGVPPLLYAEMVAQSGVECDGFGVELVMGAPRCGLHTRDLFQISTLLDRFASLGKPIFLTAVAAPDRPLPGASDEEGGRWHEPWSPELQARWLRAVYRIALSKTFVENLAWSDLADFEQATVLPGSGLLDDMLRPKPAFNALQELRRQLKPAPQPGTPAPAADAAAAPAPAPPIPAPVTGPLAPTSAPVERRSSDDPQSPE